ncbi:Retron-type RNA-directed DNA polymerase [Dehalobacter sp. UNSWDHB]|jgi:Retron-type reverse transcriptase|uniref:group II intron reverse transcriptase/maturase n=1 Tax=unclassified Dehalobacter TaxID=2635733 RepID=UPI00028AA7A0|nr:MULTISPECIES: group II intron reverse transcriptase/maturase [unclassified Dehalobacter]AFV02725.1 Retron-type reverse transcriptase [Dehalobacter sp. DCA]AFV05709.1 Retron-type reverse transcriptase [Dehalobacter sp. CF]EQB22661.1 Retron-type RNA-directed DNA polymerase [Dehalobacter sp. UNSWDHB]
MEPPAKDTLTGRRTGETVRTKLASIAQRAQRHKKAKFCSLAHLMSKGTLREAFRRLSGTAASGIDGETKASYGGNLEENLRNLLEQLKEGSYRPTPVRRKFIPKAGSNKLRPLGIPVLEDKLVQNALVIILESIYEQDFLEDSYGFRPGRSQHDALKDLSRKIGTRKVGYIVDADIRGYFDHVDHEWLLKMLQERISDSKILKLIKRFLKAGVMEEGKLSKTEEGVPQGGSLSPLLGNIYLHYVLDLWFNKIITKQCQGEAYLTRFADDTVACFQYQKDAERFYEALKKRLKKFNLEIAEEKTRIIEFGRYAQRDVQRRGGRKPETFDFLGITHYCGRSRKGRFKLRWKTARKKFQAKLIEFNEWIKTNRNLPFKDIWKKVNAKLRGHYNYYGVSDNWQGLLEYRNQVERILYKWLKRRSQRTKLTWPRFNQMLERYPLVRPKSLINLNSAFV